MWILAAVAFLSVLFGLFPMLIAHPLIEQTPGMLTTAYWVRTVAPVLSLVFVAIFALVLWRIWPKTRQNLRILAVLMAIPVVAVVLTSRSLFTEWFFAPAAGADFVVVRDYSDIADDDMVMGIEVDGKWRAYPIRYLAFHHMLNDQLGSAFLLPTY
jgi:hypothetical protein